MDCPQLSEPAPQQFKIEMVTFDDLIPQEHLLHKIVNPAMNYRMVGGRALYTEMPRQKANANKK